MATLSAMPRMISEHDGGRGEGDGKPLLATELSHRIKNVFALVSSLVSLSAREQPGMRDFAQAIQARIQALARAHDYLLSWDTHSARPPERQTMQGLLRVLTAPYKGQRSQPIAVEGADARVGLRSAGTIALIVHELATNAVKYGALSNDTGRIRIVCAAGDGRFVIEWREEDGPPVAAEPDRRGFGTLLAERIVAAGRIEIERSWRTEGLRVRIAIPAGDLEA
jgi:two-component sensor histidine kinase